MKIFFHENITNILSAAHHLEGDCSILDVRMVPGTVFQDAALCDVTLISHACSSKSRLNSLNSKQQNFGRPN